MDLSQLETSARHAELADVTITPRFGPAHWRYFHLADLFLAAGRRAALEQLPALQALSTPVDLTTGTPTNLKTGTLSTSTTGAPADQPTATEGEGIARADGV